MKKYLIVLFTFISSYATTWGDFPRSITLNSGETQNITANGISGGRGNAITNRGFEYLTLGNTPSYLNITTNVPQYGFYNSGVLRVGVNSNLSILLDGIGFIQENPNASYVVDKNASLSLKGSEISGIFNNKGTLNLDFSKSVNLSDKTSNSTMMLNDGGVVNINTQDFNNGRNANGRTSHGVLKSINKGKVSINLNGGIFQNNGYIYDIWGRKRSGFGDIITPLPNPKDFYQFSSILLAQDGSEININGGNVYNGGYLDPYSGNALQDGQYYANIGDIIADNGVINIQRNLISEGAGRLQKSNQSQYFAYSNIKAINNGTINVGGNFQNREYSNIYVYNSEINVAGNFSMEKNSQLYFSGNNIKYGKITANNISITNIKDQVFFYKGSAKSNVTYIALEGKNSLSFDPSILGEKQGLAEDGSKSIFYDVKIKQDGNNIEVTFIDKLNKPTTPNTPSSPTSQTNNPSSNEDNSTTIQNPTDTSTSNTTNTNPSLSQEKPIENSPTQSTPPPPYSPSNIVKEYIALTQNQSNIIDGLYSFKDSSFDITNLGVSQIQNLSESINNNFDSIIKNHWTLNKLALNVNQNLIFSRMNSKNIFLSSNQSMPHYALNQYNTNPETRSDYTNYTLALPIRFKKKSSIYASFLGGYEKNSFGNSYAYGINIGYDYQFNNNFLLGIYGGYVNGNSRTDFSKLESQNLQLGIYSRSNVFSLIETDLILSYNVGFNQNHHSIALLQNSYRLDSDYATHSLDGLLQIGPLLKLGNRNVLKPYVGINLNLNLNGAFNENGILSTQYNARKDLYIGGLIGIEYRNYLKNGSHVFIRPSYEFSLYSTQEELTLLFLNNTLTFQAPKKEQFGSILLGGVLKLNKNLILELNANTKSNFNDIFIVAGNASLRFLF